jgi:hypothetical protein
MHWSEQLHQFRCSTNYWPLVHGVELSDGARYVMCAAHARWLMLVIARELRDAGVNYIYFQISIKSVAWHTRLKFSDIAGSSVFACTAHNRRLDVADFELRAAWCGSSWLVMLPAEDLR